MNDLETLCRDCHRKAHGLPTYGDREFWDEVKRLDLDLNYSVEPDRQRLVRFAKLARTRSQVIEARNILIRVATLRLMQRSRHCWSIWVTRPPRTKARVFTWADAELRRLKRKRYVRKTLRKHV